MLSLIILFTAGLKLGFQRKAISLILKRALGNYELKIGNVTGETLKQICKGIGSIRIDTENRMVEPEHWICNFGSFYNVLSIQRLLLIKSSS